MEKFHSKFFPEMNPFWTLLGRALNALKIECKGFCFAFYDSSKEGFNTEYIGNVTPRKMHSFLRFALLNAMSTLELGDELKTRSKNIAGCKQGAIVLYDNCVSINGNVKPGVAEAIAALWLMAKNLSESPNFQPHGMAKAAFWQEFRGISNFVQGLRAKENNYISGIALEMQEQFNRDAEFLERIERVIRI